MSSLRRPRDSFQLGPTATLMPYAKGKRADNNTILRTNRSPIGSNNECLTLSFKDYATRERETYETQDEHLSSNIEPRLELHVHL